MLRDSPEQVFAVLMSRVILFFELNLYIPVSKVRLC